MTVESDSEYTWWKAWKEALTHPTLETFENLSNDPAATSKRAYKWLFTSAVIASLLHSLSFSLNDSHSTFRVLFLFCLISTTLSSIITVVANVILVFIVNKAARCLGGTGSYRQLLFAMAAYLAPFSIFTAGIWLITGWIGQLSVISSSFSYNFFSQLLISLFVVYGLIVMTIAVKAVCQLSWPRVLLLSFFGFIISCGAAIFTVLILSPLLLLYAAINFYSVSTAPPTKITPTLLSSSDTPKHQRYLSSDNFRIEATAKRKKWYRTQKENGIDKKFYPVEVEIRFTGEGAAQAFRHGPIKISTAEYYVGNLKLTSSDTDESRITDHTEDNNGFKVKLHFLAPSKGFAKITTLKGTITVQYIDLSNLITIVNLDSLLKTSKAELDAPRLNSIGKFFIAPSLFSYGSGSDDNVTFTVKGQSVVQEWDARVVDTQGNKSDWNFRSSGPEHKSLGFAVPAKELPGYQLEIFTINSLEAPFALSDIMITED